MRPDDDPEDVEGLAALMLRRLGPTEPDHEDAALAHVAAFALLDLRACRAYLKALCTPPKG